ncbi:MAG: hypothetical protein SGCHY_005314 [Lobulomycetales sp.]
MGKECRNIAMFGYCKFEGNGCRFQHTHPSPTAAPSPSAAAAAHNPPMLRAPVPDGSNLFLAPDRRTDLQAKARSHHSGTVVEIPHVNSTYHSLVLLNSTAAATSGPSASSLGWPSTIYQALMNDGTPVCLRRLAGFSLAADEAIHAIEPWTRLNSSGIVRVREAFTTRVFSDTSLVIVSDWHAFAKPMLIPNQPRQTQPSQEQFWSFICQIAGAIDTAHANSLAIRALNPSKVLTTGKNRVRISGCGVLDVLLYTRKDQPNTSLQDHQHADLIAFGQLILVYAFGTSAAATPQALPKSLDTVARVYGAQAHSLVLYLLGKPNEAKSIETVMVMVSRRLVHQVDAALGYADSLEEDLMRELENGRMVRMMAKLGFINERPEFQMDPSWSETGDRYIIKLFRDHVFHMVDASDGRPVLDMSHVVYNLNKLDAFSDERIMLMSRDEQSCLIVSYREVATCIYNAYNELLNAANAPLQY